MKRRNADCGKIRRPVKRTKIAEGIYGSTFLYVKFLLVWALVLLADFILEFRFEYLWPFWLLLRSVYDSFKYQGLAFSVFFVFIAFTSDMICFLFIPVHWLFFAASTYVWVQYVWHTERGICLPTISLWLLFVYIEASVRLKELKNLPFHLDLCRPFAAHCIGYPVVTLGFGFKSYVGYRMRLRKQKEVAKENEFYMQLLQQALPTEAPSIASVCSQEKEKASKVAEEVSVSNGHCVTANHSQGRKSICGPPNGVWEGESRRQDFQCVEVARDFEDSDESCERRSNGIAGRPKWRDNLPLHPKRSRNSSKETTANSFNSQKDDHTYRLECDLKRLRVDLQLSRASEQELRSQVHSLSAGERSAKSELLQLQQENEALQHKLQSVLSSRQQDKQGLCSLEKRMAEERRLRTLCESQLAAERKAKKVDEAAAARALASARTECTENCKSRRRDSENEMKQLRRDLKIREEKMQQLERQAQCGCGYGESTQALVSALGALEEKNARLETSLSAETRLKLDLFSALGEAKRQLEIAQSMLGQRDKEIDELKSKVAEVMAVMPVTSGYPSSLSALLYSPKFGSEDKMPKSNLDPNASVYTPKVARLGNSDADM